MKDRDGRRNEFSSRCNIDKIGWLRFAEEIVIDMILYCIRYSTWSQVVAFRSD